MKKLILIFLASGFVGSLAVRGHRSTSISSPVIAPALAQSPQTQNLPSIPTTAISEAASSGRDFAAKFADLKAGYANYQDSDLEAVIEDTNRQAQDKNWIVRANREELSAEELEAMNEAFDRKAAATSVLVHHHLEAYRAASL